MIFTKGLSYEDIKKNLNKEDIITIIGCQSCTRVSGTGGEEQMRDLALSLREEGFNVKDGYAINEICTPKVMQAKLDKNVNTVITMACSAGTSNAGRMFSGKKVVSTCKDIGLMTADTKEKTIKVAMPYDSCKDEKGKEYKMFSGEGIQKSNDKAKVEVEK